MTERFDTLRTPALVVDTSALDRNIDTMAAVRPGNSLRPHVKAFKSTSLARHVLERGGHHRFCCATLKEMEGMARAGLGEDLLLANQTLDTPRLRDLVAGSGANVTVAVDSAPTLDAAATAGADVLIDINVGLPRCGCSPEEAPALTAGAIEKGLRVRGVMGYEGHVVGNVDRELRELGVARSMSDLERARDLVVGAGGGALSSAGGTGTYDLHPWADEVQAGSYLLMDTAYAGLGLPFEQALWVLATVISVNVGGGFAVLDAGLKAFGMDHGNPSVDDYDVFFCSDEHTTILARDGALPAVGDRLLMTPAHIDPTVAVHETMRLFEGRPTSGDEVIDDWAVDLRNW